MRSTTAARRRPAACFDSLERRRLLAGGVASFATPNLVGYATDQGLLVQVVRSGDISDAATVDLATTDQSATKGTDYVATSRTLTFAAGAASTEVTIPLLDPGVVATPTRTFNITLSNPTGGLTLGNPATTMFTESATIEETTATTATKLGLSTSIDYAQNVAGDITASYGQRLDFTAVVGRPNPGPGFVTGMVSFTIDGGPAQAAGFRNQPPLFAGTFPAGLYGQVSAAYLTAPTLAVGTHTIVATYAGDATSGPSTDTITATITKAAATVSLVEDANPAYPGQNLNLNAYVDATDPAAGAPTGTVTATIYAGSGAAGRGAVEETLTGTLVPLVATPGRAVAVFATKDLTRGPHDVVITYGGDAHFAAATGGNVAAIGDRTTITVAGPAGGTSVPGQPGTFTATVTTTGPASGLTGAVIFVVDGQQQAPVPITVSPTDPTQATATFTTAPLAAGTHVVGVVYSGAFPYTAQSNAATVFVTRTPDPAPAPATIALTTVGSGAAGQPFVVVATATDAAGVAIPNNFATLVDGTTIIASTIFDAAGHAVFYFPALPGGVHNYGIVYDSGPAYAASPTYLPTFVATPAPPVTAVTAVARLGATNRPTAAVALTFAGSPDPTAAGTAADYQITTAAGRRVGVRSATYDAATHVATLRLAAGLAPRATYHVRVAGAVLGGADYQGTIAAATATHVKSRATAAHPRGASALTRHAAK